MPLLSGCLPVAAVGAGASIGYVATEDRSMKENVDDAVLCATINRAWVDFNSALNDDLDCHAYQARVLVTGQVPNKSWRGEAISRANQVQGVKEVYDEITVGPGSSFANNAHDGYITQHLKGEFLTASDVHSNNYIVTTANGVVFIIGTARDQAEINRVIDYGRNMNGVKRVVSYIRIRAGAGEETGPGNAAASGNPAPGDTAPNAPTPRGEIVVTPLQSPPAGAAPAAPPRGNTGPAAPLGGNSGPAAPPRGNSGVTPLQ
ncbi:MAG TPA: BON domain-containing protein [Stellaceae bacterium]|nr:BON domain-containing protein [Stellaceae bacterium]